MMKSMMRHGAILLMLILSSDVVLPQADHFPLNVGNSWTYLYGMYEWDQLPVVFTRDTGTVRYTVIKKEAADDSTLWYFLQYRSVKHRYSQAWLVPPQDTTYMVTDTVPFIIVEYHTALHRILPHIWDWTSVYYLGSGYPDSIRINRYRNGAPDTVRAEYQVLHRSGNSYFVWPKFTVTSVGSVGIQRIDYSEPDYSLYVRRVTAVLMESMLTGVRNSGLGNVSHGSLNIDNYPNPFNPSTTISVIVPVPGRMVLQVYDAIGREVERLYDGMVDAGEYRREWNSGGLPSGMYICMVTLDGQRQSRKMFLIR